MAIMDKQTNTPETRKKEVIIGASIVIGVALIIMGVAYAIYSSTPKVVYQPTVACDLFTSDEARELLGGNAIKSSSKDPVQDQNTATSTCGYANGDSNTETMKVAAVMIRSGVNDEGVEQNKTEFAAGKPQENVEDVKDLGDSAYFNKELGQLNILKDKMWIIVSNGVGSAPQANTLEDAVKLAKKVLN